MAAVDLLEAPPEIRAGESQARVCGIERNPEYVRDFRHRVFLEIVHDQNGTLLVRESFERLEDNPARFEIERVDMRVVVERVLVEDLALVARSVPVVRSDAERDSEEPGRQRARTVVIVQMPMDDDEDLVGGVFEITFSHAEAPEAPADAIEVLFEQVTKEASFLRRSRSDDSFHTWVLELSPRFRHRALTLCSEDRFERHRAGQGARRRLRNGIALDQETRANEGNSTAELDA